ncbi:hypothetical protein AAG906_035493 [Vitis piasezkii]
MARTALESIDIFSSHSWSHSNQKRRKLTSWSHKKPKQKDCKEIERKNRSKNRVKTEQKQSSARFPFCCQTIPQHIGILCENFRSCEGEFGTRVPLRSTGAPISQLRNGCEHSDTQFAAAKRIAKWLRK